MNVIFLNRFICIDSSDVTICCCCLLMMMMMMMMMMMIMIKKTVMILIIFLNKQVMICHLSSTQQYNYVNYEYLVIRRFAPVGQSDSRTVGLPFLCAPKLSWGCTCWLSGSTSVWPRMPVSRLIFSTAQSNASLCPSCSGSNRAPASNQHVT